MPPKKKKQTSEKFMDKVVINNPPPPKIEMKNKLEETPRIGSSFSRIFKRMKGKNNCPPFGRGENKAPVEKAGGGRTQRNVAPAAHSAIFWQTSLAPLTL